VLTIQNRTAELLRDAEEALLDAMDAIVAARKPARPTSSWRTRYSCTAAQSLRWDFISSENSTGFHSPQESARVLGGHRRQP
jgi:nitrite reductase (cytochrome c-552)